MGFCFHCSTTGPADGPREDPRTERSVAKQEQNNEPSEETHQSAMFLAMVVRNAMEDFHCEHLTDKQMEELNPIIRNAICTGLHAVKRCGESEGARAYVKFQLQLIPKYWESPELMDDFVATEEWANESREETNG